MSAPGPASRTRAKAAPTLEARFSVALHTTTRGWRMAIERRLKASGLSNAGWLAIASAASAGRPLAQSELAQRLGVEPATMVAMVDRLVGSGLVVRQPSETDRRVNLVVLTPEGKKLYKSVKVQADAVRRELLASIDRDQLLIATELLEKLQAVLEVAP
ncbi:MAG: MarR family transcriptional regulator [Comamonadaceae bacterium]|nr:MAG: MarR family transcriptional regulator [Comamonadaceae bacterium]